MFIITKYEGNSIKSNVHENDFGKITNRNLINNYRQMIIYNKSKQIYFLVLF